MGNNAGFRNRERARGTNRQGGKPAPSSQDASNAITHRQAIDEHHHRLRPAPRCESIRLEKSLSQPFASAYASPGFHMSNLLNPVLPFPLLPNTISPFQDESVSSDSAAASPSPFQYTSTPHPLSLSTLPPLLLSLTPPPPPQEQSASPPPRHPRA